MYKCDPPKLYHPDGRTSAPVFSSMVTRLLVRSWNNGWRWRWNHFSLEVLSTYWQIHVSYGQNSFDRIYNAQIFYHESRLQSFMRLHVLQCEGVSRSTNVKIKRPGMLQEKKLRVYTRHCIIHCIVICKWENWKTPGKTCQGKSDWGCIVICKLTNQIPRKICQICQEKNYCQPCCLN